VFTTTAFAPVGAVTLPVAVSQSITTTIAAGALVAVFVDTGVITPSGNIPQTDQTAGPGVAGYATSNMGVVANPNGVSLEFFEKAINGGFQASVQPYWQWVMPRVANMHVMPRDLTNANTQTVMEGQGFQNPNWGSGPFGQWPFASTQVIQRARVGAAVLPVAGYNAVAATV
jgi:anti-sigma factor RsiW